MCPDFETIFNSFIEKHDFKKSDVTKMLGIKHQATWQLMQSPSVTWETICLLSDISGTKVSKIIEDAENYRKNTKSLKRINAFRSLRKNRLKDRYKKEEASMQEVKESDRFFIYRTTTSYEVRDSKDKVIGSFEVFSHKCKSRAKSFLEFCNKSNGIPKSKLMEEFLK